MDYPAELYRVIPHLNFLPKLIGSWVHSLAESDYSPAPDGDVMLYSMAPYQIMKAINERVVFNVQRWNHMIPVFSRPHVFKVKGEYGEHIDRGRDAAINMLVSGNPEHSTTYWMVRGGSRWPYRYNLNEPILFNTQIPHGVTLHNDSERVMFSMDVNMGFPRFCNLLDKGLIFG